jgi:hypothetical protein
MEINGGEKERCKENVTVIYLYKQGKICHGSLSSLGEIWWITMFKKKVANVFQLSTMIKTFELVVISDRFGRNGSKEATNPHS